MSNKLKCSKCNEEYNPGDLDAVFFHEGNHEPAPDIQYGSSKKLEVYEFRELTINEYWPSDQVFICEDRLGKEVQLPLRMLIGRTIKYKI